MKLWLDDVREPWKYGRIGWEWVKTADDAIAMLKTGKVEEASLDHDLSIAAVEYYLATGLVYDQEKTGYTVCLFLEEHPEFLPEVVHVHTANSAARPRMLAALASARRRRLTNP